MRAPGRRRTRGRAGREDGALVLWFLGLCLLLLTLAGLGLDLWRGFSERRALAAIADAAAFAGASGIDEDHFRRTGETRLDPRRARFMAARSVGAQTDDRALTGTQVTVDPGGAHVTVVVTGEVPVTLLALLTAGPLEVAATATAEPRLSE